MELKCAAAVDGVTDKENLYVLGIEHDPLASVDHQVDRTVVRRQGFNPFKFTFEHAAGEGAVEIDECPDLLLKQSLQPRERVAEVDRRGLFHAV